MRADEYVSRVEQSGWLAGLSTTSRAIVLGRLAKNPHPRELATAHVPFPAVSYVEVLEALASPHFQPEETEESEVPAAKMKKGVFRSKHSGDGTVIAVTFCLGDWCYCGAFSSEWADEDFLPFVNAVLADSMNDRQFYLLDRSPLHGDALGFVDEETFEAARKLGLLPGVKPFRRVQVPAPSVVSR